MMFNTFHAPIDRRNAMLGEEMPCRFADSESIAEIRIANCHRVRIGQFPIGAGKCCSVIGITGLW